MHHMRNRDMMVYTGGQHNHSNGYLVDRGGHGQYAGPSYSVKYLGIVDGSMGVLSRKMALLNYN